MDRTRNKNELGKQITVTIIVSTRHGGLFKLKY